MNNKLKAILILFTGFILATGLGIWAGLPWAPLISISLGIPTGALAASVWYN